MNEAIQQILLAHAEGVPFRVRDVVLTDQEAATLARFKRDVPRFTPSIFDGEWWQPGAAAVAGAARVLAVVTGVDKQVRVVLRQGGSLYGWPAPKQGRR